MEVEILKTAQIIEDEELSKAAEKAEADPRNVAPAIPYEEAWAN